jgi:hypothetical protein
MRVCTWATYSSGGQEHRGKAGRHKVAHQHLLEQGGDEQQIETNFRAEPHRKDRAEQRDGGRPFLRGKV